MASPFNVFSRTTDTLCTNEPPCRAFSIYGWVPRDQATLDAGTGRSLAIGGGLPTICGQAVATSQGLDLLERAGVDRAHELLTYGTRSEYFNLLATIASTGDKLAMSHLHPNGLIGSRSLLDGVRRLQSGHLLRWRVPGAAREEHEYSLFSSEQFARVPQRDLERVVESTFEAVLARHAPGGETALLLSGGLDSRLLAGYLVRRGVRPVALCLGVPTDLEMLAAESVAASLQLPFQDLDQAHWMAVRHSAEPYRRRLATWLNPPVVDRILPRPDAHIGLRDPCGPGASYRSLLGLMLFTKTCSPC